MKKTPSLSISNSKTSEKFFLKVVTFITIFFILNHWIGLKLEKSINTKNLYSIVKWEEFYTMEPNSLDIVFLGSSHAYRTFDPEVFDENLNTNSFNMGSPLQKPIESYYVLKETFKYQKPPLVVYDVYWGIFNEEKYFNTKSWNFDNMKFSINKIEYLLNVFDQDQYLYATFKSVRHHDVFKKIISGQPQNQNLETNLEKYLEEYKGKGFIIDNTVVALEDLKEIFKDREVNPTTYQWDEKQLKYFYKIIELCKKENVELVLVTAPLAPTYVKDLDTYSYKYEEIHEYVKNIAQEENLKYVDYNMVNIKDKIVDDSDFADSNHLNYPGAQKISLDFSKRLNKIVTK